MKHNCYILGFVLLIAGALPTFAQFTGTISDTQGVRYSANKDKTTCYVSGHEDDYNSTIVIPEIIEGCSVTSIGSWVFENCSNLTSVSIPSSVTSIGSSAFDGCSNLTSVSIPEGVTSIGDYAFNHCSSLTSITIPSSVTSIGESAFNYCSSLTSLTIPSSVTSIFDGTFSNCSSLTSITIPSSVTSIGKWAFDGCSSLTSITIPSSVTSIGESAFRCCALTSVTIPEGVTSIGRSAFECDALTSVTIPSSVTSIGERAFYWCTHLYEVHISDLSSWCNISFLDEYSNPSRNGDPNYRCLCLNGEEVSDLVIPNSVTSIGNFAFMRYSSLTSVTIPYSVKSIGDDAFAQCNNLTSVTVEWDTPLTISDVFSEKKTLYVPKGTKPLYQAADVWKDFENIVEYEIPFTFRAPNMDVSLHQKIKMPIELTNNEEIVAYQFDLTLPEGFTMAKDSKGQFMAKKTNRYEDENQQLTITQLEDGSYRFICFSMNQGKLTGSSGAVLNLTVTMDNSVEMGSHQGTISNIVLTKADKEQVRLYNAHFGITVNDLAEGDSNGDGEVNVSDIVEIVNYIMEKPSERFAFNAADIDGNGEVNVTDIVLLVDIIMAPNAAARSTERNRGASRDSRQRLLTEKTATDELTVDAVTMKAGEKKQVAINLNNTQGAYTAFQFDLVLPDGVSVAMNDDKYVAALNEERKVDQSLTVSQKSSGVYRLMAYSMSNAEFSSTSGPLVYVTLQADAAVNEGIKHATLTEQVLTAQGGEQNYLDDVDFDFRIFALSDTRVLLDENATSAPEAANGVDVRIVRTIYANEWSTICLPFAMTAAQVTEAFGDGVLLGDFNGYVYNEDDEKITVKFNSATAIEANHPYIIKVTERVDEFTVDGVDIVPSTNLTINKGTSRRPKAIIGNYIAGTKIGNGCLFLNSNKFYYSVGTTEIGAYRAYFNFDDLLPEFEDNYAEARITITFDDEATGIDALLTNSEKEKREVFNLKGTRVIHPKRGIYVKDGKKVVIK